ncbi:hypothetical protein ACFE04_022843 [Oxalis oulophora]
MDQGLEGKDPTCKRCRSFKWHLLAAAMGRSPGKWIKGLFAKKSSKSNLSKGRQVLKPANREEPLIATKTYVPESTVEISQPTPIFDASNEVGSERGSVSVKQPCNEVLLSSVKDGSSQTITNSSPEEEVAKLSHAGAAVKAQAAFRGYRARRAFKTLKGIIRLQALIRGHLVRRQAGATFHCVSGIVKLQALARGRMVRCSEDGIEVQKSCNIGILLGADSSGKSMSNCMEKLPNNVFICKLVASPSTIPLHVQYGSEEPNSEWEWLERWTNLRFWALPKSEIIKPKKQTLLKSQSEHNGHQKRGTEQGRPKKTIRKPSSAISENGFNRSSPGSDKPKRVPKKVLSHPVDSVQEHTQNGDSETSGGIINETNTKDEIVMNGNQKNSLRRASLPAKIEEAENGTHISSPKVPSYMAPTKSAKAKLRAGQGSSPRVADSIVEKNETTRRHSLPSSTNGKISSMSPRVPKLVQAAGKGVVRIDSSLSSSRDGFERAEWKR